jgi:AmiR/NasT family two-component response regulator
MDDQVETLTPEAEAEAITRAIAEFVEHRAVIEQAKGVLMAVYEIDEPAAFDLLKWRSQHTNTKLRLVAEQLMTHCRSRQWRRLRPVVDQMFLHTHERINGE